MKTFKTNTFLNSILFLLILSSSVSLFADPCDALISIDQPETPSDQGKVTVLINDLSVTHNVLIWTPSGDVPAIEVAEGEWFYDGLEAGVMYKARVFAYENGNDICEVGYPLTVVAQNGDNITDICGCPDGVLNNFSFEEGTEYWTSSEDDDFEIHQYFAECGDDFAVLDHDNGPDAYVYQQVNNIEPGSIFDLEFFAGAHDTDDDHYMRVAFYDSNENLIDYTDVDVNHDVDDTYGLLHFSEFDIIAPPQTDYLRLEAYGTDNHFKFDAICLALNAPDLTGGASGSVIQKQTSVDDEGNLSVADIPVEGAFVFAYYYMVDTIIGYSALTDASGNYNINYLVPENYNITASTNPGYLDYSDQDDSNDGDAGDLNDPVDNSIPVVIEISEIDTDNNFVDIAENASLSGKVLVDLNTDGIGDTALAGVTLNLFFLNGEPATDAFGSPIESVTTDNDGKYSFENLAIGNYIVVEEQPFGHTSVVDGDFSNDGDSFDSVFNADNEIYVSLTLFEEDTENNFIENYSNAISGIVMADIDEDDIGDEPLVNVELKLTDPDGAPVLDINDNQVANVHTNASGYYEFNNLEPGLYLVEQIQPAGYDNVFAEDMTNDDAVDIFDTDIEDNFVPVSLSAFELDENNDFCEKPDCQQSPLNEFLTVGAITNPGIVGSEYDIVNSTFVLVNSGDQPLSDIDIQTQVELISGNPCGITLNPIFAGDPNNNGLLDPNEVWFYSAINTYPFGQGDSFVVSCGATGMRNCVTEIGGAADILFTSGVNMDVDIAQGSASPGDTIDITLTTRLLVDEDVAINPGFTTLIINGQVIEIELTKSRWNAKDLKVTATGLYDNMAFDPFDPPMGIPLLNFCDQGGLDAGRNNCNVLDEQEPIDSVRFPCSEFGEDDILCEYPDWVFCYQLVIPENYQDSIFTVTASDDFSVWVSQETEGGSNEFEPFEDISANIETSGSDSEILKINLPIPKIEHFVAEKVNTKSELTWMTSRVYDNGSFIVERSNDNANFEAIGQIEGDDSNLSMFEFIDAKPLTKKNYYRIAQVDSEGNNMIYSDVRTVDFLHQHNKGEIKIFPNPVTDIAFFHSEENIEELKVEIFTLTGRQIVKRVVRTGEAVDLSELKSAQYNVKVFNSSNELIASQIMTIVK